MTRASSNRTGGRRAEQEQEKEPSPEEERRRRRWWLRHVILYPHYLIYDQANVDAGVTRWGMEIWVEKTTEAQRAVWIDAHTDQAEAADYRACLIEEVNELHPDEFDIRGQLTDCENPSLLQLI